MTDNGIIKALECCMNGTCEECPMPSVGVCSKTDFEKLTLDLIKRKNAEIERLQNAYKQCAWERDTFLEELKTAKSEARKEFAERLEAIYTNDKRYDRPDAHTLLYRLFENIDNLLKEMENK